MKFVNIKTDLPKNQLINKLKKADYYNEDEKFSLWSLGEFDHNEVGIHLSYDEEKDKVCAYNENGSTTKDFVAPINSIFSGKIVEKNNKVSIKGLMCMSPIFNIMFVLILIAVAALFIGLRNTNAVIIFVVFVAYFVIVKTHYKANMDTVAYFLGEAAMKKKKKINPNKKKGKYSRR